MIPAADTGRTAEEMAAYVLIKRGLYWRPNAMGYTGVLAEAGLYTEAEASARSRPGEDGVTMQLASEATEFAPACWQETKIAVLSQQVAHLRAENANLRDRVREAEKGAEAIVPTPEMIAAAWAVVRDRWPGQPHLLGPGPAFREAIQAALAAKAAPLPETRSENTGGRDREGA